MYYYYCYITCREDDRPNKYILYAREINIGSKTTVVAAAARRHNGTYIYMTGMMGYTYNIIYVMYIKTKGGICTHDTHTRLIIIIYYGIECHHRWHIKVVYTILTVVIRQKCVLFWLPSVCIPMWCRSIVIYTHKHSIYILIYYVLYSIL